MSLSEQDREELLSDDMALAYCNLHSSWARQRLASTVEAIVQRAVNAALTDAADYLREQAGLRFDEHTGADERGAALWDAATWLVEEHLRDIETRRT